LFEDNAFGLREDGPMDLKVRRAALSAAIKVTVSASLLSCGGIASSSNPPEGVAGGASADRGGTGGTASVVAGDANVEAGGTANAQAGGAANTATAGAPTVGGAAPASDCGSTQTKDCLAYFDGLQLKPEDELPEGIAVACCQVVMDEMAATASNAEGRQCSRDLQERLDASGVFYDCCWKTGSTLAACTPWGPPVPAELSLAQLLAWEDAA
jgi:hypothetical protein